MRSTSPGLPASGVIETKELVHVPHQLLDLYPDDPDIQAVGAARVHGVPLQDTDGHIWGHMAVVDRRPTPDEPRLHAVFLIFAVRTAAELQRLRAEAQVREREERLGRLLNSAMDATIELDARMETSG